MKGCSKRKSRKSRKYSRKHRGGSDLLAYNGTGGTSISNSLKPATIMPTNPNGVNSTMPNTGPQFTGVSTSPTNQGNMQRGGNCGGTCGVNQPVMMTGGSCGGTCGVNQPVMMTGGGCGCGKLLTIGGQTGGSHGTWAPQGLIGKPWTPSPSGWPGVNGSRNYLDYNQYKADPQTAMINVGANPPFLTGGKKRRGSRRKKQKGGALSNFIFQDLVNLGRQTQYGVGSTYNGVKGFPAPTNPLPWKDQLTHNPTAIRNALL